MSQATSSMLFTAVLMSLKWSTFCVYYNSNKLVTIFDIENHFNNNEESSLTIYVSSSFLQKNDFTPWSQQLNSGWVECWVWCLNLDYNTQKHVIVIMFSSPLFFIFTTSPSKNQKIITMKWIKLARRVLNYCLFDFQWSFNVFVFFVNIECMWLVKISLI